MQKQRRVRENCQSLNTERGIAEGSVGTFINLKYKAYRGKEFYHQSLNVKREKVGRGVGEYCQSLDARYRS